MFHAKEIWCQFIEQAAQGVLDDVLAIVDASVF